MTAMIVAALIIGWLVLSCLVCVAVCMASSRFSAELEQQAAGHRQRRPRAAARVEGSAVPVKVKAG